MRTINIANNQNASLEIQTRVFEVDMAQNLICQGDRNYLTEVNALLKLPMKSKFFGWKKILPRGSFKYEIILQGVRFKTTNYMQTVFQQLL